MSETEKDEVNDSQDNKDVEDITYKGIQAHSDVVNQAKDVKDFYDITWTEFIRGCMRGRLKQIPIDELQTLCLKEVNDINDVNEVNDMNREELIEAFLNK